MKICAIVGAGDFFPERFDRNKYDFIIAADGGAQSLDKIGITPNLVVGDFDSGYIPDGVEHIRYKVEKDETDTHLAFAEGVCRGYDIFYVFGGVGGREDHTFANYCLLYYAKKQKKQMYLMSKNSYSFIIEDEEIALQGMCGGTFSVFSFGGDASGVCIKDAKYEAENINLKSDFPLGVSNSFTEKGKARISAKRGALLIMSEYEK